MLMAALSMIFLPIPLSWIPAMVDYLYLISNVIKLTDTHPSSEGIA